MKLKNLPWILVGVIVIALGMFYDRILNLPSEGFQDLVRALYVILLLYPALFFIIGLITNYREPTDWGQLVILTLTVVLVSYLKIGKLELDRSWLVPATYPLFNPGFPVYVTRKSFFLSIKLLISLDLSL